MIYVIEKLVGIFFVIMAIIFGNLCYTKTQVLVDTVSNVETHYIYNLVTSGDSETPLKMNIETNNYWKADRIHKINFRINGWTNEWGNITINLVGNNGQTVNAKPLVLGDQIDRGKIKLPMSEAIISPGEKKSQINAEVCSSVFSCVNLPINVELKEKDNSLWIYIAPILYFLLLIVCAAIGIFLLFLI